MAKYNLVQYVFDREALSPGEDVAVMTMHIRKTLDNFEDFADMDDQARDHFVGQTASWWTSVRPSITQYITFRELRFYDVPDLPGAPMGDPVRVQPVGTAGSATSGALPPQISLSVTFITDTRLWWGRFYIPGISRGTCSDHGRVDPTVCNSIATATSLLTNRSGTGGSLVVFSRKHWTHKDPTTVQVDDIYDVIRRRRFSLPNVRAQAGAGGLAATLLPATSSPAE